MIIRFSVTSWGLHAQHFKSHRLSAFSQIRTRHRRRDTGQHEAGNQAQHDRRDTMNPSPLAALFLFSGLAGLVDAAAGDTKNGIIPNHMVVFVAGAGLALRLASGLTSAALSLVCAGLAFVVLVFLTHRNMIGGGDAKLIAAATLLVPSDRIVLLLLNIALAGGLLSCFYIVRFFVAKNAHQPARRFVNHLFARDSNRKKTSRPMPYALAILGGVLASMFSEVFQCFSATSCSL